MEELKKFLVKLPKASGYKDDKNLRKSVYKALYYSATNHGKYLDLLFRDLDSRSDIDPWLLLGNDGKPFYENVIPEDYTHPSDQACGRVLQSGEKVYRCIDCGYDDTCVICSYCFRREDHEGHNVSVYLSQANGGMCDCGDETAFVRKLNCACLANAVEAIQLPTECKTAMRSTLQTALNYVLDVTNYSINTLPFIHQNINGQGGLQITSLQISDMGSLPMDVYGEVDDNTNDKWYLILWNDEDHDYPEAEMGIRSATGMSDQEAKHVADEINRKGRAILKESLDYSALLPSQKFAQADGLVATISTARDFIRESIILQIFNWIKDVISFEGNSSFRDTAKKTLAEVLLEPGFELSKPIPREFLKSDSLDVEKCCMLNGIPLNGNFFNLESKHVKPNVRLESLAEPLENLVTHDKSPKLVRTRILYLLAFEVRFVSILRKRLTRSIFPVLFVDPSIKASFCEHYINAYPMLTSILAFSDREEELASSSDISVQLFTCPKTNKWIFESGNFPKLLYPMCKLIEDQSSVINEDGFPNLVDIVFDIRSKREKSSIQNTVRMCIENVTRVVTKNDEINLLNHFLENETLPLFLIFLRYFQGLSPVKRKYGDHVERESITEFYSFVLKAVPISSIVHHATRVTTLNYSLAKHAIETIFKYLESRKVLAKDAQFRVSKNYVSPFNPINSFFSFVLQELGLEAVQNLLCDLDNKFYSISDFSLRNIVLVSQVKIGLWVRNGMTAARQICYLLDALADVNYSRDLYLNQVTATVDHPEETLMNFLERWELSDWFLGNADFDKTVYEQRFSFICERFILFLYKVLVDRLHFDKREDDVTKDDVVINSICYALCEEPKSYSKLKKLLPLYISKSDSFDRLLKECTEYQAPVGLYDVGMYRLKASLYENLDPMGQMDGETSQYIFEALFTNIAKHQKRDVKKVILLPKICYCKSLFVNSRIGAIFRTKVFAKLVYKLLRVAIDSNDEEYLPHLLHLLHATILDSERVLGTNHLEKSLVMIPICNLLLTISESSMSIPILLKADFLLDQFVSRDGNVMDSLIDCFGEAHIETYKHRKENLSESKRQKSSKLAQTRKAKIMKKFAKQREKFLEKNDMFGDRSNNLFSESQSPVIRNCVYCGEAESVEKPFGIPSVTKSASAFWKLSPEDPALVNHAFSDYSTLPFSSETDIYSRGYPQKHIKASEVISSCAHGTHIHCQERARFIDHAPSPCPLCHNLYDDVTPSYLHDIQFFNPSLLEGGPSTLDPTKLNRGFNDQRNSDILNFVVQNGYFEDGILRGEFADQLCSVFGVCKPNDRRPFTKKDTLVLKKIERHIANAIRANEISLRIDGKCTNSSFINEIPFSLRSLIRSLIQSRLLLYDIHKASIASLSHENLSGSNASGGDGIFEEIVSLLFSTNESFQTLMRFGFTKMIALNSITLCSEFETFLLGKFPSGCTLSEATIQSTVSYCETYLGLLGVDFGSKDRSYFENFYLALERCVLPFLRQCSILIDILIYKQSPDADVISDPRFEILSDIAEQGNYEYSSDPLCQLLNLHKLSEICGVSNNDSHLEFELEILKHHTKKEVYHSFPSSFKNLDYPNVPRLINLPDDFNLTITDPRHVSPSDKTCLVCGERVLASMKHHHQNQCSPMCLLFCPEENSVITFIEFGRNTFDIGIPGPYMTEHGEVKRASLKEKATLNHLRYAHLNKLWINQELFGFATRTMYGERMNPMEADIPVEALEEDSFDDLEFWE